MTARCESCGARDRRTTNNRLPDGQTLDLCYPCVRDVLRCWRAWKDAQPAQARYVTREARQLDMAREILGREEAGA